MEVIGRKREIDELQQLYQSGKPEFVALYGRRRVGKTYLVKELFSGKFTFWHTGMSPYDRDGKYLLRDQLQAFLYSLQDYGYSGTDIPKTWLEAFRLLELLLNEKDNSERMLIFIDELPWMDTPRSRFIPAFEHFWNSFSAKHSNVMLIVCGSATAWMMDNVVNNKGGLYNRLNTEIMLSPFTLAECEQFFQYQGITMSRYEIAQAYMVFGGVPHYLSLFDKRLSLPQNIDHLLFDKNAKLGNEFDRLFGSLFKNAGDHEKVVRLLATRRCGFTRSEILSATDIKDGGGASEILLGLEVSQFICKYKPFGESKIDTYRLSDPFCLFYLHFLDGKSNIDNHFWQNNYNSPRLNTWKGLAFEDLCFSHLEQIKSALGIAGINSTASSWIMRDETGKPTSQIDMLIQRSDNNINLCEIKFCAESYNIDKAYDATLRGRLQRLISLVPVRQTVKLTLITTFGIKRNEYSGQVQNEIILDDLFHH